MSREHCHAYAVESGDRALVPASSKRKQGTLVLPLHTTWMPVFPAGGGVIAGAGSSPLRADPGDVGVVELLGVAALFSAAGELADGGTFNGFPSAVPWSDGVLCDSEYQ
jgi:hypothetical protein